MFEGAAFFGSLCHSEVGGKKLSSVGRVTAAVRLSKGMKRMK